MRTQLCCSIRHTVLVLSTLAFTLMALSSGAFALTFTTINASDYVQGATSTFALGINAAGQIVGGYIESNNEEHGFVAR
jgi:hypothetical protein